MEMILLIIIGLLILAVLVLNILILIRGNMKDTPLMNKVAELQIGLSRIETGMREEFRTNREENGAIARENRTELSNSIREIQTGLLESLAKLTEKNQQALQEINKTLSDRVEALTDRMAGINKANREEQAMNLKEFAAEQGRKTEELVKNTEAKLESIRVTVEEKLEKTLSERLGQSFETVGKQLIEVQKGLGEMQTIATDVGGLKKVLSNVKLRGGVGEVQLAMLLEQILAPGQYDANVRTKQGSADPVEFAIKLPGRSEDENEFVYLPIDAKFPKDTYEHLIEAYENAIPGDIEDATVALENTIKKMARDIRDKYIDPPNTTDFAIMFLPFESIYAEVIRRSPLVDQLRDEFKITVAGSDNPDGHPEQPADGIPHPGASETEQRGVAGPLLGEDGI